MFTRIILLIALSFSVQNLAKAQFIAPEFKVTDIKGQSYSLYNTVEQNKFVILHLFSPSTTTSKTIASKLDSLYTEYGSGADQLEIFGLEQNLSILGNIAAVNQYVNELQLTFPNVDRNGGSSNASKPYLSGTLGAKATTNSLVLVYPNKEVSVNISLDSIQKVLLKYIKKKVYHYTMWVKTPYNLPVEDATFKLRHFDFVNQITTPIINDVTGKEGMFRFSFDTNVRQESAPNNICIEKTTTPTENVSTYDLILVSKHIIGSQPIQDKFKLIAADVNHSGQVTVADVVELRKMLLRIDEENQYLNSWRMFRLMPTDTSEMSCFVFDLKSNENEFNFIGVKVGDVSYVCADGETCFDNPNQLESRNEFFDLITDDIQLNNNQLYTIHFYPKDWKNFIGMQGTFHFDASKLSFLGFQQSQLKGFSSANLNLNKINEGIIPFTWNDVKGFDLSADAPLFSMQFQAKSETQLSQALSFKNDKLTSEAYIDNSGALPMQLLFQTKESIKSNEVSIYGEKIHLSLVDDAQVTISIFDALGRLLDQTFEGKLNAGKQQIQLPQLNNEMGMRYARVLVNQQLIKTIPYIAK